jgi:hypothetical protein
MSFSRIMSDQLFTWSDIYANEITFRLAQAPPGVITPTAAAGSPPSRLTDRALQALWQARLQVCSGSRSRSQVLPVCKLPAFTTTNGLRTSGGSRSGRRASQQLPADARDLGRNLRDQPRTAAPPRGALRSPDERYMSCAHRHHRSGIRGRPAGQYVGSMVRRSAQLLGHHGGIQ